MAATCCSSEAWEIDTILCLIIKEENASMIAPFTRSEIEAVVRSMPQDKASGHDGLLVEFYR